MKVHHKKNLPSKCNMCGKSFQYFFFDREEKNGRSEVKYTLESGADVCRSCYNDLKGLNVDQPKLPKTYFDKDKIQIDNQYRSILRESIIKLINNSSLTTKELDRIFIFIKHNQEITLTLAKAYEQLQQ